MPEQKSLETLPLEIILQILKISDSFGDLWALISSTPIAFRLFRENKRVIWEKIAHNMIGEDAWKDATTLLAYQRKLNECSKKNLPDPANKGKFVIERQDIRNIINNERFIAEAREGAARDADLNAVSNSDTITYIPGPENPIVYFLVLMGPGSSKKSLYQKFISLEGFGLYV